MKKIKESTITQLIFTKIEILNKQLQAWNISKEMGKLSQEFV